MDRSFPLGLSTIHRYTTFATNGVPSFQIGTLSLIQRYSLRAPRHRLLGVFKIADFVEPAEDNLIKQRCTRRYKKRPYIPRDITSGQGYDAAIVVPAAFKNQASCLVVCDLLTLLLSFVQPMRIENNTIPV